ncbi:MAG TPA: ATP-binding protein [Methanothrix sp.]|nr:ATP-binding protein [Methanothrix sp.]
MSDKFKRHVCRKVVLQDGYQGSRDVVEPRELATEYSKFTQLRSNAIATRELDLSAIKWFYPTLLLPLGVFIKQNKGIALIPPKDKRVSDYFDIITRNNNSGKKGSYLPIIEIPKAGSGSTAELERLNSYASDCGGTTALQYFIGELVDNIYQHSQFSTAYITAQKYPKLGFLEFCIVDNGISIPQSYEDNGILIESDKVALDYALKGISTKKDKERGCGLRTSIKLLTSAMNGTCLIVSRRAGLGANKPEGTFTFDLNEEDIYYGTLISISLPFQRETVEIYGYIE